MQPNRLNMKELILNVAEFKPDNSLFAKGGLLEPKDAWDRLSIPKKADIIKVGVKHGIFDLQDVWDVSETDDSTEIIHSVISYSSHILVKIFINFFNYLIKEQVKPFIHICIKFWYHL